MKVINGIDNITRPLKNPVLTIGNFDGVHRGHQTLFQAVKDWAKRIDGESAVMTFNPHPLQLLFPDRHMPFITSHERKLELIEACGIDAVIVIPFTLEFSKISAHDFVKKLLVDKIGIKAVIVGYDYKFGHGREGNIDFLRKMGSELGFDVEMVSGIRVDDTVVSSTAIRNFIKVGDIGVANKLLGRPYEVTGTVIGGRQRGRLLGFPTANLTIPSQAQPKPGVYATEVIVDGKIYGGASCIGYSPTFGENQLTVEIHILDFHQDIYGQTITVRFVDRLRDEKKFSGVEELTAQIRNDVERTREILAEKSRASAA